MKIFPLKLPIKASSALITNNKNEILLLKRSNLVKSYQGYWQLPEGKVNMNESAKQALVREIDEEIGVKTRKIKFIGVFSYIQKFLFIPILEIDRNIFKVEIQGKIRLSEEHLDYAWVSKSKLYSYHLLPGMRDIFKELFNKINQGE